MIVAYSDGERLSSEKLAQSTLRIEIFAQLESGSTVSLPDIVALPMDKHLTSADLKDNEWNDSRRYPAEYADIPSMERYWEEGVLYFKFDVPPRVSELTLRAFYEDEEGESMQAKMKAIQYYSPAKKYISVRTKSADVEVGEFAVFHVKTNFILQRFQYMVRWYLILIFLSIGTIFKISFSEAVYVMPLRPN